MTSIEDTHLALGAFPFNVEVNNSLKILAITNIREQNCRVSVPVQPIIPCSYALGMWSCLLLQYHAHRKTQLPFIMHCTNLHCYTGVHGTTLGYTKLH